MNISYEHAGRAWRNDIVWKFQLLLEIVLTQKYIAVFFPGLEQLENFRVADRRLGLVHYHNDVFRGWRKFFCLCASDHRKEHDFLQGASRITGIRIIDTIWIICFRSGVPPYKEVWQKHGDSLEDFCERSWDKCEPQERSNWY